ncbi:MAG: hypothetical protein JWP15_3611 [Alphaproteobacteria bacterium]|nr:hypothetical protein [Alphaproteobacteria bacterium]
MRILIFLLGLSLVPSAAHAEWREATSTHFIVYSEGSEEQVRQTAVRLEKYDFLLRFVTGVTRPPSPIRLKVYMVEDVAKVENSLYGGGEGILGYYNTGARGPFAVMPRGKSAESVLFHEYTHHFMFQYFPAAYPTWYTEGFAEYYGMARILDDNLIEVGQPAQDRYSTFAELPWLPVGKLLTAHSYADVPGEQIFSLYAEGWLLTHFMGTTHERGHQLNVYLGAINAGKSYAEATKLAFGDDIGKLDDELLKYSRQRHLSVLQLHFKPIDTGPIAVRQLSGSEAALIYQEIKLSRGVLAREAKQFASDVRFFARKFPDDPHALSVQVQAEQAAGNGEAAVALVDHWLAVQPDSPDALLWKSKLDIAALAAAGSKDPAAWGKVRSRLLRLSRAWPTNPFILEAYYDSFAAARIEPPAEAQNALFSAFELLPQYEELRYKLALDFEQRGMIEDAISTIKPAAFALSDAEVEDAKKKQKREAQAEKWRLAETARHETPREMLVRLEAKLGAQAKAAKQPA